ncbi:inovirus Gp2 family protein [uncultured Marinobacter sp.]|uniref:inovirus Gp2 family protein n=1 Tax=uncultured Marinobacter sp. TaxID=187379 RepID=UPI0030DD0537|tara:strand:- start:37773 stop:38558 length:786 start_codon:yes stop_codon:yes gene_type:complete
MSDTPYLHRHSLDPNLWIYNGYYYRGMKLNEGNGPFIYNYLRRIDETILGALNDHAKIMVVRVELRLPDHFNWEHDPSRRPLFSRFISSLKARIEAKRAQTIRNGKRFHSTKVHYVWTREFRQDEKKPHYHCALFFNKQTFLALGEFNPTARSLYGMISNAWASALRMDKHLADGLVSIPDNPIYRIRKGEPYDDLFYRISYFAKLATKLFGRASHNFGSSRTDHLPIDPQSRLPFHMEQTAHEDYANSPEKAFGCGEIFW